MKRDKIVKSRYLRAFIITLAVFSIGLFLGSLMDNYRTQYFVRYNEIQKLNIRSMQLQFELNNIDTGYDQCRKTKSLFDFYLVELENNRERLNEYAKETKIKKEDFEILRREYVLSQINFWLLSQSIKENCPDYADFNTVLYFYSNNDVCPSCGDQSFNLDYYKIKLKTNLLIFALDEQFGEQEPLINMLKDIYNINSYPTVVINNKVYDELLSQEELKDVLCSLENTDKDKINC